MVTDKRRCGCGGSETQHTGDDGCWCKMCLRITAEADRCQRFEAVAPEPAPVKEKPWRPKTRLRVVGEDETAGEWWKQ